jgi:hypothetical protein
VPVGAPCFSRGELDFSPAEKRSIFRERALALGFLQTSAKAHDQVQLFPGALKRSSPRMNAGAPTKKPLAAPALRTFFNRSRFFVYGLKPVPIVQR